MLDETLPLSLSADLTSVLSEFLPPAKMAPADWSLQCAGRQRRLQSRKFINTPEHSPGRGEASYLSHFFSGPI